MRNKVLFSIHSAYSRAGLLSSLELGDGTGPATSNLWSVSTPELSFTANGFSDPAWLRSQDPYNYGISSPYARRVNSNGSFARGTTANNITLRPAVHITEPKIRFVIKPQYIVICMINNNNRLWKRYKLKPN